MAEKQKRIRRTKVQTIEDKIAKLDMKINPLMEQRAALEQELQEIKDAEIKAKEEATIKAVIQWMNDGNYTMQDLENMMNKPETTISEE